MVLFSILQHKQEASVNANKNTKKNTNFGRKSGGIMRLDKEAVEEFKKLYLQEYGVKLTDNQAMEYGIRLIRFVRVVYGNHLPPKIDKDIKNDNN